MRICSVMFDSATPWMVAHQAPLSMGFPRQEYWSGLPFLSPGNLLDPGIKSEFPALDIVLKVKKEQLSGSSSREDSKVTQGVF